MANFKDLEHQGWTEKAQFYDDYFGSVTRQAIAPLLAAVGALSGRRVLDICCGTGDLAAAAAKAGADVTGIDFAEPMVEIARTHVPGTVFDVGDAEQLAFAESSFDVATCAFGLWHIADPDAAISEAARVLKPGGVYAYAAWLPPDEGWDLMGLLMRAIKTHGTLDVDLPPAPPPFRFAQMEDATAALRSAGFGAVTFHKDVALWEGNSGDDLLDLVYKSIVRAPMLIEAQTPDAKQAIREEIRHGAEAFRGDTGIRMRWPYLVACATKT